MAVAFFRLSHDCVGLKYILNSLKAGRMFGQLAKTICVVVEFLLGRSVAIETRLTVLVATPGLV